MRKSVSLLGVAVALVFSGLSEASVIGPRCWTIPPFTDVLSLSFITDDGGSTAAVAGRDLSINTAVTGGAARESDGVTVNMVATVGQASADISAFLLQVRFSSATGAGSGRCQTVNPNAGGCVFGTNISFVSVACPVGSTAQVGASGALAGGGE